MSDSEDDDEVSDVRVPRAEQLVIDACADVAGERVLCTSVGWGQLAIATKHRLPTAQVACHFLDLHPYEQARHTSGELEEQIDWQCTADLPAGPFDVAAVPVSRFGEAELTRDMLQDAYERLAEGGVLVTAVDNRDDTWLAAELSKLFSKVTREPQRLGIVYRGVRRGPLKRKRDFRCEFAFRDQGRLVKAVSRPGVFSHRQLDLGARALLEVMEVRAGDRVVDMGCGSGAAGLAAALRAENVFVQGIDSNARAVECMRAGAVLNGIADVTWEGDLRSGEWRGLETGHNTAREGDLRSAGVARSGDRPQREEGDRPQLQHEPEGQQPGCSAAAGLLRVLHDAEGRVPEQGTYDVVVGNPPYYSHYQIADIFLKAAKRALKPGARVHIVTKKDEWHQARMGQLFKDVESREVRGYKVVSAVAR